MKASTWRRVRSSLVLVALALSLALVPQLTRSAPVRAQTASTTLTICGLVSGYTAAGPSATGAITIGGGTPFIIAANPTVAGAAAATLANGQNLCFVLTLNASNQITAMTVTTNTPSTVTLCGPVSAYTLASSTAGGAQGSITIGTQTFTIVSATTFTGPAAASVANGQNLCFALSLNGANQITAGTVTASTTPGPGYGTGTMQLCGVVTAYTAPTATGTGTIAVAGQTFTIAAGVTTTATISPGTSYCFLFTFGTGGQIATYTVSANLPAVSIVCGVFTAYTPAAGGAPAYMWVGGISFPVQTTFVPVYLVRAQVYCFLLGTTGYVVGLLSGVPTLATPYEAAGSAHRVGRLLAQ